MCTQTTFTNRDTEPDRLAVATAGQTPIAANGTTLTLLPRPASAALLSSLSIAGLPWAPSALLWLCSSVPSLSVLS